MGKSSDTNPSLIKNVPFPLGIRPNASLEIHISVGTMDEVQCKKDSSDNLIIDIPQRYLSESTTGEDWTFTIESEVTDLPITEERLSQAAKEKVDREKVDPPKSLKLLSSEEFIQHLKKNDVSIPPEKEQKAKEFFEYHGFIRINSLLKALKQDGKSDNHISYKNLIIINDMDTYLRQSLARLTPYIELHLKTLIVNEIICWTKSPFSYEKRNSNDSATIYKYDNSKHRKATDAWLSRASEIICSFANKDRSFTHALSKYGCRIPIWLLVDRLSLGETIMFVDCLNKDIVFNISKSFIPNADRVGNIYTILDALRTLRNAASHGTRLVGTNFSVTPKINSNDNEMIKGIDSPSTSLFVQLVAIKYCFEGLQAQEKERWNCFIDKINIKIKNHKFLAKCLKMPENWYQLLKIAS